MYDPANNPMEPGRRNVSKVIRNEILKNEPLRESESSFRKFSYYVYAFFAIGFIMRFFHVSGAGFFLWTGFVLTLLLITMQLIEGYNKHMLGRSLLLGTIHFAIIYLFFRFQEWDTAVIVYVMCALLFIIGLVLYLITYKKLSVLVIIATLFLGTSVYLSVIPDHVFYYHINLTETFHTYTRQFDPWIWNNYAWMLYDDGEYNLALQANIMAMVLAKSLGYDQLASDYHYEVNEYMWPKSTILSEDEINKLDLLIN